MVDPFDSARAASNRIAATDPCRPTIRFGRSLTWARSWISFKRISQVNESFSLPKTLELNCSISWCWSLNLTFCLNRCPAEGLPSRTSSLPFAGIRPDPVLGPYFWYDGKRQKQVSNRGLFRRSNHVRTGTALVCLSIIRDESIAAGI